MGSGHFPCGSVDWNSFRPVHTLPHHRHFPCGSVDWNSEEWEGTVKTALSLPLRKCGLKSAYTKGNLQEGDRHFPCGSVDWNTEQAIKNGKQPSHFPCGSVDWNMEWRTWYWCRRSHFPCGSVDWNFTGILYIRSTILSLPLRKCGLKFQIIDKPRLVICHFPCGSVDWNRRGLDKL